MKKLLSISLLTLLLVACKNQNEARYASESAEIEQVKSLIQDYDEGNWESWASHYADTVKIYHNSTESISAQELKGNFEETLAYFASYGFQDKDMFHEMIIDDKGERWVNFWANWEGTLRANNKKIILPVHITVQFVGDKIIEEHAYYNMEPVSSALKELEAAKKEAEEVSDE